MVLSEALDTVVVFHAQRLFKTNFCSVSEWFIFHLNTQTLFGCQEKTRSAILSFCARVLEFVLACRVCCSVGGDGSCSQQGECCRGLYRYAWLSNRMLNEGMMNEERSAVPKLSYRQP